MSSHILLSFILKGCTGFRLTLASIQSHGAQTAGDSSRDKNHTNASAKTADMTLMSFSVIIKNKLTAEKKVVVFFF